MNNDLLELKVKKTVPQFCWDSDVSFFGGFDGTLRLEEAGIKDPKIILKYKNILSFSISFKFLLLISPSEDEILYSLSGLINMPEAFFLLEKDRLNDIIYNHVNTYFKPINEDETFKSILIENNLKQCESNKALIQAFKYIVDKIVIIQKLRNHIKEKNE